VFLIVFVIRDRATKGVSNKPKAQKKVKRIKKKADLRLYNLHDF